MLAARLQFERPQLPLEAGRQLQVSNQNLFNAEGDILQQTERLLSPELKQSVRFAVHDASRLVRMDA